MDSRGGGGGSGGAGCCGCCGCGALAGSGSRSGAEHSRGRQGRTGPAGNRRGRRGTARRAPAAAARRAATGRHAASDSAIWSALRGENRTVPAKMPLACPMDRVAALTALTARGQVPSPAAVAAVLSSGGGLTQLLAAGLPAPSRSAAAQQAAAPEPRDFLLSLFRACDALAEDAGHAAAAADARCASASRLMALLAEGALDSRCAPRVARDV
jgi:hypothetical protein